MFMAPPASLLGSICTLAPALAARQRRKAAGARPKALPDRWHRVRDREPCVRSEWSKALLPNGLVSSPRASAATPPGRAEPVTGAGLRRNLRGPEPTREDPVDQPGAGIQPVGPGHVITMLS